MSIYKIFGSLKPQTLEKVPENSQTLTYELLCSFWYVIYFKSAVCGVLVVKGFTWWMSDSLFTVYTRRLSVSCLSLRTSNIRHPQNANEVLTGFTNNITLLVILSSVLHFDTNQFADVRIFSVLICKRLLFSS